MGENEKEGAAAPLMIGHRTMASTLALRGDLIEAIFLLRAYRTTLARFGASEPIDTGKMLTVRRVSATFKDLPGGQVLGPTFDYTHRLLDPELCTRVPEKPVRARVETNVSTPGAANHPRSPSDGSVGEPSNA